MKFKVVSFFVLMFSFFSCFAQTAVSIIGKWTNEDKTQIIQVYKKDNFYVGKLVGIDAENANLMLDSENKEEQLRKRKLIGADVWLNFEYQEDKQMWKNGEIYNYKTGNSYTGKIQIEGPELRLTGYYGFCFFLAKTQKWIRIVE